MKRWRADPTEENFWGAVLAYAGVKFKTYTGLPFLTKLKKAETGNTQRNSGSTAGKTAKVWRGARCCWH